MNIEVLRSKLISNPECPGLKQIIYFEEIDSTNLYAKSKRFPTDDILIITSHQTKGTGRLGRSWESSPGENLTFTLVKNFRIENSEWHLVNFYTSYILYDTLMKLYSQKGIDIKLKWPNDILINGKKAAGILIEMKDLKEVKQFIIGIGLNVNQKKFSENISGKATSISNELNEDQCIEEILIWFIRNFYSQLSWLNNKEMLMSKWRSAAGIRGKKIYINIAGDSREISATVLNVDSDGGLKVITGDGKESKYYSGEISMVY